MKSITLTPDQRSQLLSWVMHERDHMMALRALAREMLTTRVAGIVEMIEAEYDGLEMLKKKIQSSGSSIDLTDDEVYILLGASTYNKNDHYTKFWSEIGKLVGT